MSLSSLAPFKRAQIPCETKIDNCKEIILDKTEYNLNVNVYSKNITNICLKQKVSPLSLHPK